MRFSVTIINREFIPFAFKRIQAVSRGLIGCSVTIINASRMNFLINNRYGISYQARRDGLNALECELSEFTINNRD